MEIVQSVMEAGKALTAGGILIVGVVLVLVEFLKQFKRPAGEACLTGNALLGVGFGIGFVMAVMAYIYNTAPPTGSEWHGHFVYWFMALIYGVIVGVMPSGTYELLIKRK